MFIDSNKKRYADDSPEYVKACETVANQWRESAKAVKANDPYASHVTEEYKEAKFKRDMNYADQIEFGEVSFNFTIWQRINTELTGECPGFLSQ